MEHHFVYARAMADTEQMQWMQPGTVALPLQGEVSTDCGFGCPECVAWQLAPQMFVRHSGIVGILCESTAILGEAVHAAVDSVGLATAPGGGVIFQPQCYQQSTVGTTEVPSHLSVLPQGCAELGLKRRMDACEQPYFGMEFVGYVEPIKGYDCPVADLSTNDMTSDHIGFGEFGGHDVWTAAQTGLPAKDPKDICSEWMVQLEAGGQARQVALAGMRGMALRTSFDRFGCRAVQLALTVASSADAASLVAEFHGHVCEAIHSPHANYVIQKVVETLPTTQTRFVGAELAGSGASMARHRYGCRILCRLIEHSAMEQGTLALVDEILLEVDQLIRHSYGHHVIESVLEHGTMEQQRSIMAALFRDLAQNARHQFASHVIEQSLTYCCVEDQNALAAELFGSPEDVVSLAESQFGCFVVKALLRLRCEHSRRALGYLRSATEQLRSSRYGKRILGDLKAACAAAAA